MPENQPFARFYDQITEDPTERAARVVQSINTHFPSALSLLELGCGTGSILARLTDVPSLTGLDHSPDMLAMAKDKVPRATLVEADMRTFSLHSCFDVVLCVYDSLNHLLHFDHWQTMFAAVHDHLVDDGLFIFDVTTMEELRRLGEDPPLVQDFDHGVAIVDVSYAEGDPSFGMSHWDFRIFERRGDGHYQLHHKQLGELGVGLPLIMAALEPLFSVLEVVDECGLSPTPESAKAHVVARRLP